MNDREESQAARGIEARIQAMRARVAEAVQQAAAARERSAHAAEKARALAWALANSLGELHNLPVRVPGVGVGPCLVSARESPWPPLVTVQGGNHLLIAFTCSADLTDPGAEAWVEHDDTRITLDAAQDLAVAAVEAALADDPPPALAYPDDDVPF